MIPEGEFRLSETAWPTSDSPGRRLDSDASDEVRHESGRATVSTGYRRAPRRRGDSLETAIFTATMDEIREVGYIELTMERVAARARASKGSLYRRWSSRAALVVDALEHTRPHPAVAPNTGDTRTDILGFLRSIAEGMNGADGEAARGLTAECVRYPELMSAVRERFTERDNTIVLDVLRRGMIRGQVRPAALTHRVAEVGPALLRQHFLSHGAPIPNHVVTEIVDEVVMPLVDARPRE